MGPLDVFTVCKATTVLLLYCPPPHNVQTRSFGSFQNTFLAIFMSADMSLSLMFAPRKGTPCSQNRKLGWSQSVSQAWEKNTNLFPLSYIKLRSHYVYYVLCKLKEKRIRGSVFTVAGDVPGRRCTVCQ